ncbi:MAG: hypothetical protein ACOYLH_08240 [Flavobacteriales bacterium]
MITRKFTMIYFGLAPVLFALSWYISYKIQITFMTVGTGHLPANSNNKPLIYASIFSGIYLAAYLVIRDIYRPTNHK